MLSVKVTINIKPLQDAGNHAHILNLITVPMCSHYYTILNSVLILKTEDMLVILLLVKLAKILKLLLLEMEPVAVIFFNVNQIKDVKMESV
jgi:hypothetical protein